MEGNQQKMREALEKLDTLLFVGVDGNVHGQQGKADEIERIIKSALSAPPRNCDVGTAEEQTKRRQRYCKWRQASLSENRTCRGCPVYDVMMMYANEAKDADCDLIWAQMPYEAEEGGAE